MKRNQRKILVLELLTQKELTAREILKKMNNEITIGCMCTLLKRYQKWALLNRKKKKGNYFYSITKKGLKRLEYLISDRPLMWDTPPIGEKQ